MSRVSLRMAAAWLVIVLLACQLAIRLDAAGEAPICLTRR